MASGYLSDRYMTTIWAGNMTATSSVSATTTSGRIRGAVVDGVSRFYGVPYTAAPVGALRFEAPRVHPGWTGERDATQKGANAPQILRDFPGMDVSPFIGTGWRKGDEYLVAY